MEEFFETNQIQLLRTTITVLILLILKFIATKTVKRVGRKNDIVKARTLLVTKYVSFILSFLGIGIIAFIWSVDFRELGLLLSSVFTLLGVALFASWSILSNVTAGAILFFSFPFKIGDRILVMDKEISEDEGSSIYEIENIKAFHMRLKNSKGQLVTYPNNMMLQKGVILIDSLNDHVHNSK